MMDDTTHSRLVHALTEWDIRQSKTKHYNRWALGQYFQALDNVKEAMAQGANLADALMKGFNGALLRYLAKKVGLNVEYSKYQ